MVLSSLYFLASEEQVSKQLKQVAIVGRRQQTGRVTVRDNGKNCREKRQGGGGGEKKWINCIGVQKMDFLGGISEGRFQI